MVRLRIKIAQSDFSMPENFKKCIDYLVDRNIDPKSYPFYWTPKTGFSNRIIIPFLFESAEDVVVAFLVLLEAEGAY